MYRMARGKQAYGLFLALITAFMATSLGAQAVQPDPSSSSIRYNGKGQVVGTIAPDPDGAGPLGLPATRTRYDALGIVASVETGSLSAWQPSSVTPDAWPGFTVFRTVTFTYDTANRKVWEVTTDSGGQKVAVVQSNYDKLSRPTCTAIRMNLPAVPAAGLNACQLTAAGPYGPDRITRNAYDEAGQLLQVRQAVGTSIEQAYATYAYDLNGNRTIVVDANGNKAELAYDGLERLSKWTFPGTARPSAFNPATAQMALATAGASNPGDYELYQYDTAGNRTSFQRRNGNSITYAYDGLNRVTQKSVQANGTVAAETVHYGYDNRGLQLYARFGSSSGNGITSVYDGLGRLESSTINLGGAARVLSYQYDARGNRTRITHPDGTYFEYNYDLLDRMREIKENGGTLLASVEYNARGERFQIYRGGSAAITSYQYDPAGRLSTLGQNLDGSAKDITYTYGWTPASQIASMQLSNESYGWTGDVNLERSYSSNGLNQYATAGPAIYTYDPSGNLTGSSVPANGTNPAQSLTFTYDNENKLRSASGTAHLTLSYDPMGRLWQTSGTPAPTIFLYDGDALVAEYSPAGALLRRYVHGPGEDEPLIWYEGAGLGDRRTLQADHQGSITTAADSSASVLASNSYDAWGIPAKTNSGRFQYTGQIMIPELEMYHYKARMYSPTMGRFLQTDPIGYEDQVNLYSYVGNDPIGRQDPDGQEAACVTLANCGVAAVTAQDQRNATMTLGAMAAVLTAGVSHRVASVAGLLMDITSLDDGPPIAGFGSSRAPTQALQQRHAIRGRLGSPRTQQHVDDVASAMEGRGWTITHGGGPSRKLPEEYLAGPGGGRKGSSYPDITATKDGKTLRVNTIDTRADGVTPTGRESQNAARIRAQTNEHLLLIPKPR